MGLYNLSDLIVLEGFAALSDDGDVDDDDDALRNISTDRGPSRLPLLTLLQPALFAAQDLESMTACWNWVGTHLSCSCDRVEVRCATLHSGKPNSETSTGETMK